MARWDQQEANEPLVAYNAAATERDELKKFTQVLEWFIHISQC